LTLLGWGGSTLLVASLLQARVLRFRLLNLVACTVLTVFNTLIAVWPMVAMNVVLAAINLWFVVKLFTGRNDANTFVVIETAVDDAYLEHVLRRHQADIRRFQPDFDIEAMGHSPGHAAFLVLRGDKTVGVVVVDVHDGVAQVLLDYVTPDYRDFSPGQFVWLQSNILRDRGIQRVVTPRNMVGAYYARIGFKPSDDVGSRGLRDRTMRRVSGFTHVYYSRPEQTVREPHPAE